MFKQAQQGIQVVWFKRDLRVEDHEVLARAVHGGAVLPLYILEPELWQQPDMSSHQYQFLYDSLCELDEELKRLGQGLIVKIGGAVEILEKIHERHTIRCLWSHQETWNDWTYQRDLRVKKWALERGIPWVEPMQHGVIRRLKDRDGWAARWFQHMQRKPFFAPSALLSVAEESEILPRLEAWDVWRSPVTEAQQGGRRAGLECLQSFLNARGEFYTKGMSSPVTAFAGCSRLSAHLAFGTLSLREIFHATEQRVAEVKAMPRGEKGGWVSALRSFSARLRWHCHFMQKLEDEPRMEFENLHPAYDALRNEDWNQAFFEAWKAGKTGFPMIDACMRALAATGWLNFRMRAMLMSFASYHLWLDWRQTSRYLAKLFTDYEPGIHYSQAQMQSGTTGINTLRIYNPIKQGMDHDPEGVFIRRWLPELRKMPAQFLHTPWLSPSDMGTYPMPIVDEKVARTFAATQLYGLRKASSEHRALAEKIVKKHGSRKKRVRSDAKKSVQPRSAPNSHDAIQTEFPL